MRVQMTGGSPWGFKMTGGYDFRQPLAIGKVTPGSKADRAGIAEGHHILTVNGEDVTKLKHIEAQNKIKAAKQTLVLEISNAPVPKQTTAEAEVPSYITPTQSHAPTNKSYSQQPSKSPTYTSTYTSNKPPAVFNSAPSHSHSVSVPARMATPRSPGSYSSSYNQSGSFEENAPPDIEYKPVNSRDSQRRMYDDMTNSDWAPTAHQSTQQSPSMQALLRTSGQSHVPESEKPKLEITSEIRDMILEEEDGRRNGHATSAHDGSLRPTGVKIYDPTPSYSNRSPSQPSPYSSPSSSASSFSSQHSAHSPQSSYNSMSSQQSTNTKSKAVGNISKFLQTSGAKQGQPVFAKTLQDLQCPFGDPAVLEIRIGNTLPVPTVAWYHNEKPVRESRDKDIKFLSKGIVHTLVIGEFAPEFAGRYRCVLTNKHGSASCHSLLSQEQLQDNTGYVPAPSTYGNSTARGYQPSSYQPTNNYQPRQNSQSSRPVMVSNSVGLYGKNTVNETYAAQMGKKESLKDEPEESDVMRALREQGEQTSKSQHRSRSMRMLEDSLMPESDDL